MRAISYVRPLIVLLSVFTVVQADGDPNIPLQRALHRADLHNWIDAAEDFGAAERGFASAGLHREALFAKCGRIRATMEERSLPEISAELEGELASNPFLRDDRRLRMFCLAVKGDIDGELDTVQWRKDWGEVSRIAADIDDAKWQNRASAELGLAAFMDGNIGEARKRLGSALITASKLKDVGAQIRYLGLIGTGLVLVKSYNEALPYFEKALAAASAAGPAAGYQFITLQGKLQALVRLERYDDAETLAQQMLVQAREKGKRVKESQMLITAARISMHRGRPEEAVQRLNASAGLAEEGRFKRLLAEARFELAEIHRERGDIETAEELAARGTSDTRDSGDVFLLPGRLRTWAQLKIARGQFREADAIYEEAGELIDLMIGSVGSPWAKAAVITAMSYIYAEHTSLLIDQLKDPDRAFQVLEKARGRATADLVRSGLHATTAKYAKPVEHEISRVSLKLAAARTREARKKLSDELFFAEQARWLMPTGTPAAPKAALPVTLRQVQADLAPGQMILEYVLSEPKSYCFVITRESVSVRPLAGSQQIDSAVRDYVQLIRNREASARRGRDLHSLLLSPVQQIARFKRLTIVPDGILHLLSFESLVDTSNRYLVETHEVSYASSVNELRSLQKRKESAAERTLLAVGGVAYETAAATAPVQRSRTAERLADLTGTRDEIEVLVQQAGRNNTTVLAGTRATETAFKQALEHQYRILHLAVHGFADEVHPDKAALALLPDPARSEDGTLQAAEVMHLEIDSELVVLSACDTAVGKLQGEEGIAKLARAFHLAGARTVVSTLWSVDDTMGAYMMEQFYSHLSHGFIRRRALTQAKRDLLAKYGSRAVPYYWAGAVLDGVADRPLRLRN